MRDELAQTGLPLVPVPSSGEPSRSKVDRAIARYTKWTDESHPCRDVYGGDCRVYIGPPKWGHRINRYRGEVKSHPTPEQALRAAQDPRTPPELLRQLGGLGPRAIRRRQGSGTGQPQLSAVRALPERTGSSGRSRCHPPRCVYLAVKKAVKPDGNVGALSRKLDALFGR